MTLKDYLEEEDVTFAAFAETISRSPESVRRYVNGERIPDRDTMPVIAEKTEGRVTANDFFGIVAVHDRFDSDVSASRSPGKNDEISRGSPA